MADRYTTPTYAFRIEGADLTGCDVTLTFSQGRRVLSLGPDHFDSMTIDAEAGTADISVTLSQLGTAMFKADEPIEVQANVTDANGFRDDTTIETMTLGRNLHERVMRDA